MAIWSDSEKQSQLKAVLNATGSGGLIFFTAPGANTNMRPLQGSTTSGKETENNRLQTGRHKRHTPGEKTGNS